MFIEKSKKEEMGSLNSFLWWGIVLLSIIDKIELRKLIDIDKVNYKFPCGSVQCEGIRQYCSEEKTVMRMSVGLQTHQNNVLYNVKKEKKVRNKSF